MLLICICRVDNLLLVHFFFFEIWIWEITLSIAGHCPTPHAERVWQWFLQILALHCSAHIVLMALPGIFWLTCDPRTHLDPAGPYCSKSHQAFSLVQLDIAGSIRLQTLAGRSSTATDSCTQESGQTNLDICSLTTRVVQVPTERVSADTYIIFTLH